MTGQSDLFEIQVEQEALRLAETMLMDPVKLREILGNQNQMLIATKAKLEVVEVERDELLQEIQDQFKGAKHLDAEYISGKLGLKYTNPSGARQQVSRNFFLQILELDGILTNENGGYKPSSDWHRDEKAERFQNGRGFFCVKFTQKGFESLYRKYRKDARVWASKNNRIYEVTA